MCGHKAKSQAKTGRGTCELVLKMQIFSNEERQHASKGGREFVSSDEGSETKEIEEMKKVT